MLIASSMFRLEFADAPLIVRAHQKDAYFESELVVRMQEALVPLVGQQFVYAHPEEIRTAAKTLYLVLTTLRRVRTLGEEYVDLVYVSRDGSRIPGAAPRWGLVAGYSLVPYVLRRVLRSRGMDSDWVGTMASLHTALFYFTAKYYQASKRVLGLRYAFGHTVDKSQLQNGNYELLGGLIVAQLATRALAAVAKRRSGAKTDALAVALDRVYGVEAPSSEIDLLDPAQLPYIPEQSRTCMLCLSYMTLPACAPCGHAFCWRCIGDWAREHSECPLCRQWLDESHLLALR